MYKNMKCKILLVTSYWLLVTFFIGCASGPSSYWRPKHFSRSKYIKVAIVPFTNLSKEKEADQRIAYSLITHLLNTHYFNVVEMGEVQRALKEAKVRKDEGLSVEEIKKIGRLIDVEALLMGAVEEYKIDSSTLLGEKVFVPEVSINARLVSTEDAEIIWAANHHRRGDDRVTVFGMGRIDSISELTDVIIKNIVNSLLKVAKSKRSALTGLKRSVILEDVPDEELENTVLDIKPALREDVMDKAMESVKTASKDSSSAIAPKTEDSKAKIKSDYKREYERVKKQF